MKKVLIITYRWPPGGGIGVLRCLKIAKYLREFGWEPVILTAENPSYQYLDHGNAKDIPEGIEIHKVPLFEPIDFFKKLTGRKKNIPLQNITDNTKNKKSVLDKFGMWVRGNYFIPDARKFWIKPSVKYLEEYLEENHIDAILTDGPPHTNTVIGLNIAKKFGIPWLADFQDPWTQVDYYAKLAIGKRADKKHKFLEQETFKYSSKITIASPTWKVDLESIGAKNVDVFYYGYDESDFSDYTPRTSSKFEIFHGGLLGADRNPIGLLKVLSKLIETHPELSDKLEIRLAGEVDESVRRAIKDNHLEKQVEFLGMIPRAQVIKEFETASLLLLPINKAANAKGRIPGKLFEMMRANKPILVLGPTDGDVRSIVLNKKKGQSFEYNDEQGMFDYLLPMIQKGDFGDFDADVDISEFSNYKLTGKIADYLNSILEEEA